MVVPVKSKVEISQNFVAFSEYMNFKILHLQESSQGHCHSMVIPGSFFGSIKGLSRVIQVSFQINPWKKTVTKIQIGKLMSFTILILCAVFWRSRRRVNPLGFSFFLDELGLINFRYQIILTRKSGVFVEKSRCNLSNLSLLVSSRPSLFLAVIFPDTHQLRRKKPHLVK